MPKPSTKRTSAQEIRRYRKYIEKDKVAIGHLDSRMDQIRLMIRELYTFNVETFGYDYQGHHADELTGDDIEIARDRLDDAADALMNAHSRLEESVFQWEAIIRQEQQKGGAK